MVRAFGTALLDTPLIPSSPLKLSFSSLLATWNYTSNVLSRREISFLLSLLLYLMSCYPPTIAPIVPFRDWSSKWAVQTVHTSGIPTCLQDIHAQTVGILGTSDLVSHFPTLLWGILMLLFTLFYFWEVL